jgi:DNA invertase Pin-like site-specific DNA recombinase
MLLQNESRIRALVGDDALAQQILDIIREDEQARHAELVRRQSEGLKQARERGVRLGRPPTKRPRKFQSVYAMYQAGKLSARSASQMLHVSPGTFKRWVTEEEEASKN